MPSLHYPLARGCLENSALRNCNLIESLGPVPWDTLVNPLWDKIVAAIDRSWHEARHQILNLRTSQETPAPSACQDAALEESAAEYQYYRQKALVYGEVTPNFNSLQNCPGNSYSAFQSSSASKEEGEDEAEYRDYRQRALALPHMPPLESLVCLGSPQPSLLAQVAAVGSQFGKTSQALDPVSPFRLGKPQITNETMDTKILGKNPSKALRVLVAESLLQPMVALERPTASPLSAASLEHALSGPLTKETREHAPVSPVTKKMLENVRVSSMTEQPREHVHPCPLKKESRLNVPAWPLQAELEKVPASPLTSEPLEIILACPLPLEPALVSVRMDEPIENVPASPLTNALVFPLTLSVDPFFGLGHFSLLNLYSSLPTWSRKKWWSSFFKHSSHLLSCAPILISSILGTSLPRGRYPVPRGTCLVVGSSSPGGGTRVPFYLVGDVFAY